MQKHVSIRTLRALPAHGIGAKKTVTTNHASARAKHAGPRRSTSNLWPKRKGPMANLFSSPFKQRHHQDERGLENRTLLKGERTRYEAT